MSRHLFWLIVTLLYILPSSVSGKIKYHCSQDSARVLELLKETAKGETYGKKVAAAAMALKGTPGGSAADNDSIGTIVIRLDTLSQREFLNVALAAAKAVEYSNPGLRDFEKALEEISRKKGVDTGFASQFLYGSDWIVDNVYRGNVKELTDYFDGGSFRTKTLDYVSRHKDEFPALKDSLVNEKIRVMELGFRSHRIPHQKKHSISNKNIKENLQDGDIIVLLSPDIDFDVYDIGIVVLENGDPHLVHLSRQSGVITDEDYNIQRLFKIEGQYFYGYRWLRPTE